MLRSSKRLASRCASNGSLIPDPAAGETIVRIRCATICGSDLHTIAGRRTAPAPCVLGHEMTGEVAVLSATGAATFRVNRSGSAIA